MIAVLQGIKVLDFGKYIAGPLCAGLLADLGADVIRVERPGGADDRYLMPATESGEGALYLHCNRGKRSITLDTSGPEGLAAFHRLVAQADVVIANLTPGALEHFGLDYPSAKTIRPDVILVTTGAYPSDSPMRDVLGFDGIGQSVSGAVYLTGEPGAPHRSVTSYVDFSTAVSSAYGVVAALFHRMRTGEGMHVETSLVGTALNVMAPILIEHAAGYAPRVPTGNRAPIGASDILQASDGWFIIQAIGNKIFRRWAELVGRPELLEDSRFATDALRGRNGAELSAIMQDWAGSRTRAECVAALQECGIPAGPVLTPDEVVGGALGFRESLIGTVSFDGESVLHVAPTVRLSVNPQPIASAAPQLGEHTHEVLREFGFAQVEIDDLEAGGLI